MTDPRSKHSRAGAQTAITEWEAQRHANEVAYWAIHLDEFEKRLPSLRRNRLGDMRAARMVDDVLEAIEAAEGTLSAWQARKRLRECWGDGMTSGRRV